VLTVDQILDLNLESFNHLLSKTGRSYDELVLDPGEGHFRHVLDYILSEDFTPQAVLDGGGTPYQDDYAKHVLIATALDIPMTALDGIPAKQRKDFYLASRRHLRQTRRSSFWYTGPTFALRMRPLIEGSRKSLEGYWLEKKFRETLVRVSETLGLTMDPKKERDRDTPNRTVMTLRKGDKVIRVQVKGVNSARHHAERAKILGKFAHDVEKAGEIAMPVLVGESEDLYVKIPAMQYIRVPPHQVLSNGYPLEHHLATMVKSLL
jgi:hypothetical protein